MSDKLVLNELVAQKLREFKDMGEDKVSYNYSYPIEFDFSANTSGTSQVQKITVSGSQLFIFNQINFCADGDFDIYLKDVATGRVLSEQAINSQVLSDVDFTISRYKGIHKLDIPKILSGNGELNIVVYNRSASANNIKLNFKGVSINSR